MAFVKATRGAKLALLLCLQGCMSLVMQAEDSPFPVSLSEHLPGYRTGRVVRHVSREIWTYHLFGLPQVPLGTREGLDARHLITPLLRDAVEPGQGVVRLRVRHTHTPITWLAALCTLGLITPTAVMLEADVVELSAP
ncbi:MAG: hypothetical protein ACO1RX_12855 [Candidatus Sericytochromatia bacterium]